MPSPTPPRALGLTPNPTAPSPQPTPPPTEETTTTTAETKPRLPVLTYHCRYCNHLLLASTRDLARLPRRKGPSADRAIILPLPASSAGEDEENADANANAEGNTGGLSGKERKKDKHATLLLSTSLPDKKATLVRREDGFEKRVLIRCGRCRLVMGYFLDGVHFAQDAGTQQVVYLLPGALMETGVMGDEAGMKALDGEWSRWMID